MPLRLAVFDFDLTLSTIHLFHCLAGTAPVALGCAPYAKGERGQLARVIELEASGHAKQQGGFAHAVFGGPERVSQLRILLAELHAGGVECIICTRGLLGPVRKCLEVAGLLVYFSAVWGNIGDINGKTDYDQSVHLSQLGADARFLGTAEMSLEGFGRSKQKVVARCLQERGLAPSDAVFIDDTPQEIKQVSGTCATLLVEPPSGMGQREIDLIRGLLVAPQRRPVAAVPTQIYQAPPMLGSIHTRGNLAPAAAEPSASLSGLGVVTTGPPCVAPPLCVSSSWNPSLQMPLPRLPDWGEMGLGSILPPELVQLGEAQLREEERRRQTDDDLRDRGTTVETAAAPYQRGARYEPQADVPSAMPAPRSRDELAAASAGVPPAVARRSANRHWNQRSSDETDAGNDDDRENEWPQLRVKSILVMDGCYKEGCGSLGRSTGLTKACDNTAASPRMYSAASDDDPTTSARTGGHDFRMEIADDGRWRSKRNGDGFTIGCCNQ